MKVCVLSGGSGNTKIIKALYELGLNSNNIRIITNAYDNGKSTGICRFITDTLGVSDIRKNHFKIFSNELSNGLSVENSDGLLKFYKERPSFSGAEDVKNYLREWGLTCLSTYVDYFFSFPKSRLFNYNDFSISNIVYSAMYRIFGYEYTNRFFCELLNIDPNCVLINSFDNAYLSATTESGFIIGDEADIVEWNNGQDKIVYSAAICNNESLNSKAILEVLDCDLLIISSGTFWSSIYPTLNYSSFFEFINRSKAKKLWFINTEYDNDSYNVSSEEFINHVKKLGLDLSNFDVIQNSDAGEECLKNACVNDINVITVKLGNIDGAFSYKEVAKFLDKHVR